MSWTWDAPDGVFKNHALSTKIRDEAIADTQFQAFMETEPNYGKMRGESITVTRVHQLPLATRVSEIDRLPAGRPLVDTMQVTVSEWGFKIETTEFETSLTHYDQDNRFQRRLRDQWRLTFDKASADAMKTVLIKGVPTAAGDLTISNDGIPAAQAVVNLDVGHVREARDELHGVQKCPPFRNGSYVGILSTKAARGVKNDPEYKDWIAPTSRETFMSGQMERVDSVQLIESNHIADDDSAALDNSIGQNGVCGEAMFFGDDIGFQAMVHDPELRAGMPVDLGRNREIGWYGILEFGNTWANVPSHNRGIHITST